MRLSRQALMGLLTDSLMEIRRDGSMEGTITWSWHPDHPGDYEVRAFVRTGNDRGQGGVLMALPEEGALLSERAEFEEKFNQREEPA